jgi:hypothetical protein
MYLQKVKSKKTKTKKFVGILKPLTKRAGSRLEAGLEVGSDFGSVTHWQGSADPDPYQNVKDLQYCSWIIISEASQIFFLWSIGLPDSDKY